MEESQLIVKGDEAQLRIDIYLAKVLAGAPSRTWVQKIIHEGLVRVNDVVVKANYKIEPGDEIVVSRGSEETLDHVQPEAIPLDVFYEDEFLMVVNKPTGMTVHPAPGVVSGTLVNALLYYCRQETGKTLSGVNKEFRPGIVHRLDRETSGLIIVAKDDRSHVRLARQFEKHRVRKKYLALVAGDIEFDEGVVDAPLSRHPIHHDKKSVAFDDSAKPAKTCYRVRRRFSGQATLVALFPESGRTHQLRVHMAYLGHPILGDEKYGKKKTFPRLALHAQAIGFIHPQTKEYVEFSTPPPPEFLIPHFPV